ncbi:MAG TPA: hypothetical protein VIV66_10435 [Pyrinomonadaceae bacterium]
MSVDKTSQNILRPKGAEGGRAASRAIKMSPYGVIFIDGVGYKAVTPNEAKPRIIQKGVC